jgi:hypothetical protein
MKHPSLFDNLVVTRRSSLSRRCALAALPRTRFIHHAGEDRKPCCGNSLCRELTIYSPLLQENASGGELISHLESAAKSSKPRQEHDLGGIDVRTTGRLIHQNARQPGE